MTPRADADVGSAEPDWLVDVEDVLSCLETLASKQEELQGQAQELTALLHSGELFHGWRGELGRRDW